MRRRPAPPARRAGFTLIELMICVVILGLLAAFAVPHFANTTAKASVATVKSDLRNLASAQETYFHEHHEYAPSLALLGVHTSPGVNVTLVEASAGGWSAQALHPSAAPVACAVFHGKATSVAPATVEGLIACR